MEARKYRIGNFVEYQGGLYELQSIAPDFPFLNTDEFGLGVVGWNDIKPVLLTEEWADCFAAFTNGLKSKNVINQRTNVSKRHAAKWTV